MFWDTDNEKMNILNHIRALQEADGDDDDKTSFEPPISNTEENKDIETTSVAEDDEEYSLDDGTDDTGAESTGTTDIDNSSHIDNNTEEIQGTPLQDQNNEDEDYTLDMDDDTTNTTADDENTNTDIDNQTDNTVDDPRQKLRDLENSIFNQLSEDEKTNKTNELRELFNMTYSNCQKIIVDIDKVIKVPDDVKIYDYITTTLQDLMKYIKDYLNQTFDIKTYMENMVEFEKYLSVLDAIKKVFIDIKNTKK